MLLNIAYYAIDSYPLFRIMLYKISYEIQFMLSKLTVLVHRPFSTTVQQITKDVTLSTVRESDSPPL